MPETLTDTTPAAAADQRQRLLRDLRISVTDRCNLRCTYCMPAEEFHENYRFLPRNELLSYEEIARVARVAASLGVKKLRLTGGEPLVRRNLPALVSMLREIPGIEDLALTTNGLLLPQLAQPLADAGLHRVTVSLDSLNPAIAGSINGRGVEPFAILEGIEAARTAGLAPVKVNVVVQRGVNEDDIVPIAERFRNTGIVVRYIEYMDVGTLNGWRRDQVVPADEILARLRDRFPLEPLAPQYAGEVAGRYAHTDGAGEVGVIASVTRPFCGGCTRLRLACDGRLYTCLFAEQGADLRDLLRTGASDEEITDFIGTLWRGRTDRYSEERAEQREQRRQKVEMYHVGG